ECAGRAKRRRRFGLSYQLDCYKVQSGVALRLPPHSKLMLFTRVQIAAVAVSFLLAVTLTPLVRAFARHRGMVAQPKTDRWHKKPTAMLGGVAIWASVVTTYLVFTYFRLIPPSVYGRTIINASTFLFLVGLVDDLVHTKPYQKLIGQIMGSAFVLYYGLSLPWTRSVSVNMAITIFWL